MVSSAQDQSQSQRPEIAQAKDPSSDNQIERTKPEESGSDGADVSKGRPISPSTLALMCDEGDTMFTSVASSSGFVECNEPSQLPTEPGLNEAYAEQERIVLTKFRECLNRLITLGEIKGKFHHLSFALSRVELLRYMLRYLFFIWGLKQNHEFQCNTSCHYLWSSFPVNLSWIIV